MGRKQCCCRQEQAGSSKEGQADLAAQLDGSSSYPQAGTLRCNKAIPAQTAALPYLNPFPDRTPSPVGEVHNQAAREACPHGSIGHHRRLVRVGGVYLLGGGGGSGGG